MTTKELIAALDASLGDAEQAHKSFRNGLSDLTGQIKALHKHRRKKLKKESCKTKRKSIKKDLRKIERLLGKAS